MTDLRVFDPRLFRLGIATGRHAFFKHGLVSLLQPPVNLLQFVLRLDLNPEMIEASLSAACRNGELTRGSSSIHFA